MKFRFEKLIIWQKSMEFAEEINKTSEHFPSKERFNLSSQICRAADSISLNIAEGAIGQSPAEFRRFLSYSIRSLAEVVTCLYKSHSREYISKVQFENYYETSFDLMNMMVAFRKKIK